MGARAFHHRFADGLQEGGCACVQPRAGNLHGHPIRRDQFATFGATIVYTTDGSAPSCVKERGTIYSGPVAIAANTTLKAMACALLRAESLITTATYLIRPPAAAPVFDPAPGAYTSEQHVTLTSATPGATFRYTTDGSDPSCATGTATAAPIEISNR